MGLGRGRGTSCPSASHSESPSAQLVGTSLGLQNPSGEERQEWVRCDAKEGNNVAQIKIPLLREMLHVSRTIMALNLKLHA